MKPLADGFLHRSVENAIRYVVGVGCDVAVCGTNTVEHVRELAAAVLNEPAGDHERLTIQAEAPELGRYVCRQCGRCPDALEETFRLEGVFDRQMIDFLPHDPAEAALRKVLSHWYQHEEEARAAFKALGAEPADLIAAAADVTCPSGIDTVRKARIATAKLTGLRPELL